jgi:hypothetical protein
MLLPAPVQDFLLSLDGAQLKELLCDVAAYTAEKTDEFVSVYAGPPPKPTPVIVESIDPPEERGEIDSIGDFFDNPNWLDNLPAY